MSYTPPVPHESFPFQKHAAPISPPPHVWTDDRLEQVMERLWDLPSPCLHQELPASSRGGCLFLAGTHPRLDLRQLCCESPHVGARRAFQEEAGRFGKPEAPSGAEPRRGRSLEANLINAPFKLRTV